MQFIFEFEIERHLMAMNLGNLDYCIITIRLRLQIQTEKQFCKLNSIEHQYRGVFHANASLLNISFIIQVRSFKNKDSVCKITSNVCVKKIFNPG